MRKRERGREWEGERERERERERAGITFVARFLELSIFRRPDRAYGHRQGRALRNDYRWHMLRPRYQPEPNRPNPTRPTHSIATQLDPTESLLPRFSVIVRPCLDARATLSLRRIESNRTFYNGKRHDERVSVW